LLAAGTKVGIIADTQGADLLLDGANNGTFDLSFASHLTATISRAALERCGLRTPTLMRLFPR